MPPQATDVEQAIIGAMLMDREAIHSIVSLLDEDDFYRDDHKNIFRCGYSLFSKSSPVDTLTVLKESKALGLNVDAVSLAELSGKVSSTAHLVEHCRIVKQESIRRSIIRESTELVKGAFDDSEDPLELLNQVDLTITKLKDSLLKGKKTTKQQIVENLLKRLKKGNEIGVHLTGIHELDRLLGKCEPGDLIIIAGRPGMGKSMIDNTITKHLSVDQDYKSLSWQLEMTNEQAMRRLISNLGNIDYGELKRGNIPMDQFEKVVQTILKSNVEFEDYSGVNVLDVRSRAISMQRSKGLDILKLDHGGLLDNLDLKNNSQVGEISKTTKLLKRTAKDLQIVIILYWQLNREVEKRTGAVPRLSDLRDSGSLEQDADKIFFLYRPEEYGIEEFHFHGATHDTKGLAVALVEKNREGKTGKALMKFNPENMRFESFEGTNVTQIPMEEFEMLPVEKAPF